MTQDSFTRLIPHNPELRRYVWLEFTPMRLALVPFMLFLLISMFSLGEDLDYKKIYTLSYMGFIFITLIGGSYQIAQTVVTEHINGTWDWQRLSSLSAARLLVGKMFGACLYKWYIGLWLLAVMFYCISGTGIDGINLAKMGDKAPEVVTFGSTITFVACLFLSTFIAHGLTLFIASLQADSFSKIGRFSALSLCFAPALLGYFLALGSLKVLTFMSGFAYLPFTQSGDTASISWYGMAFSPSPFHIASLLFLAYWAVYGTLNLLQRQLRYHVTIIPFALFLLTFTLYLSGFIDNVATADARSQITAYMAQSGIGISIALLTCYFVAPFEALQVTKYPLWWADMRTRNWQRLLYSTPLWMVSFAMLAGICLWRTLFVPSELTIMRGSFYFPLILFVLRDLLVLHLLVMTVARKRVLSGFWLYIFIAYIALPFVFREAFKGDNLGLLSVFFPLPAKDAGMFFNHLVPVVLQCGGLALWLSQKWQSRQQSLAA